MQVMEESDMVLKIRDQEIAVFGESGSGKTVLVSSFYGATQEPSFIAEHPYRVLGDDSAQSATLRQNYLRMRREAVAPEATRFDAKSYAFTIKARHSEGDASDRRARKRGFGALRFTWHDYPGEWFTEEPSSDEEAGRRVETFRRLLKSDVALVLVDGQQLAENVGEEERYLKSLFWSLREGLEKRRDEILADGERLTQFPRIWIITLSKADLLPDLDVNEFQDLIIQKSASDIAALRDVVASFVDAPDALSFGEDFLLLSSAQFEPGVIAVDKRIGLNLILPIATVLPLERVAQWFERFNMPVTALGELATKAGEFADAFALTATPFVSKLLGKIPKVGSLLSMAVLPTLSFVLKASSEKVEQFRDDAMKQKDYIAATVAEFQLDLDDGVNQSVFVKSPW